MREMESEMTLKIHDQGNTCGSPSYSIAVFLSHCCVRSALVCNFC